MVPLGPVCQGSLPGDRDLREHHQIAEGGSGRCGQVHGTTASIEHILQKLSVMFGMVASFNILMENFYKVNQGNNKKVPSFATRLEGTLNQI